MGGGGRGGVVFVLWTQEFKIFLVLNKGFIKKSLDSTKGRGAWGGGDEWCCC